MTIGGVAMDHASGETAADPAALRAAVFALHVFVPPQTGRGEGTLAAAACCQMTDLWFPSAAGGLRPGAAQSPQNPMTAALGCGGIRASFAPAVGVTQTKEASDEYGRETKPCRPPAVHWNREMVPARPQPGRALYRRREVCCRHWGCPLAPRSDRPCATLRQARAGPAVSSLGAISWTGSCREDHRGRRQLQPALHAQGGLHGLSGCGEHAVF